MNLYSQHFTQTYKKEENIKRATVNIAQTRNNKNLNNPQRYPGNLPSFLTKLHITGKTIMPNRLKTIYTKKNNTRPII